MHGRIVIQDGARVKNDCVVVDLEHHMLPDPVADTLSAMQEQIENLEKRLNEYEKGESFHEGLQHSKRAKRRADAS